MPELQLAFLGNPEVRRDGVPVTGLHSAKALALLCYLAITGRPHRRPALVGLLWGDMPEAYARNNLSKTLTHLRHVVDPHLHITRDTIAFDRERPYWLDVEVFESGACAQGDVDALQRAVELYRGDLLEGFHVRQAPAFEEWVVAQQARLRELALHAMHTLAAHHARRGAVGHAAAVDYTMCLLTLEPWREEAHRHMMVLLARNGQRSAALAQYEACCHLLSEELGVAPEPETRALYERIRDGYLDPVVLPPYLRAAPADDLHAVPFVARERELAQLDGYLAEALAGRGRAVLITGEAGSGKTALAAAFARRAQEAHAGLIVASGNCDAHTGTGDPYLPFREILGQLTGDIEPRWAAGAVSATGARRLWDLMPVAIRALVEVGPDLIGAYLAAPALVDRARAGAPRRAPWLDALEKHLANRGDGHAGLRQADLFGQVAALLRALAHEHPLLLTVDDLQWADPGSIDLLFHLGRRLARSRILIVGIYRPSEVTMGRDGERHPLARLIREFQRQFGPIEVALDQAGDRQFVEAFVDSEPNRLGSAFRDALYEHTRGHALCTVEVLRGMQERGELVKDRAGQWVEGPAVDWGVLPARVEGAIGERIERLPSALRETLAVASVEGEAFTAEVVAQVRGTPASEVVAQLSGELDGRHRLVVSEGIRRLDHGRGRASRYRFRHILFQEYAYGELDEVRRAYLHQAVGSALEQVHAGQTEAVAVQLARHFYVAGRMDKAAGYFLQAGDRARRLYAHAEARQHYDRALDALALLPDTEGNRRRRVDALIARVSGPWGPDAPERNLARLAEAEQLAQHLPNSGTVLNSDHLRLARIRFRIGSVYIARGAYSESIRYYRQALLLAQESGDEELIATLSNAIGKAMAQQGHFGEAERLLRQVIPFFERMGYWSEWFGALGFHGVVLASMGHRAEGLVEIQRACDWAREMDAPTEIAQGYHFLASAYILGGDQPRSIEAARQAVETAEQSGDPFYAYVGYFLQSWAALYAEQYAAGAACVAKAQALAQELGEPLIHGDWLAAVHAEIAFGAGRVQEAIPLAQHAVDVAQEMGGIIAEAWARRAWGQALAALAPPQWDEAESQLAESLRLLEEGQARLQAARTHVAWGTVCRGRGDLAGARAHWEQAAAQWERSGLDHELARTRALLGDLASESSAC